MGNLLDVASEIFEKGFDPEKDPVTDFENLPDGVYEAVIEDLECRQSEKGTEWFSFKCDILSGDQAGRKFFANLFLTEKTSKTSCKRMMKFAFLFGEELNLVDFGDTDIVVEKVKGVAIGKTVILTLKSGNPNKDGNVFQNWDFALE